MFFEACSQGGTANRSLRHQVDIDAQQFPERCFERGEETLIAGKPIGEIAVHNSGYRYIGGKSIHMCAPR
jgi:hypothetical protein